MITEKKLLDNFQYVTKGFFNASKINEKMIYWDYRKERDSEGYRVATTDRNEAYDIYLEGSETPVKLEKENENHEAIKKIIEQTERIIWGDTK